MLLPKQVYEGNFVKQQAKILTKNNKLTAFHWKNKTH